MKNNIIFVAGIHGVGKTTFCKVISQKFNIKHYSASELISYTSGKVFSNKLTENIEDNQELLINSINTVLDKSKQYFIDGHFCLIDEDKAIEEISIDTFLKLKIKSIVVLIDDVTNIYNRLEKRDGIKYNLEFINEFQNKEIAYANKISSMLNINMIKVNSSHYDERTLDQVKKLCDYIGGEM